MKGHNFQTNFKSRFPFLSSTYLLSFLSMRILPPILRVAGFCIILVSLVSAYISCKNKVGYTYLSRLGLGTTINIKVYAESDTKARKIAQQAYDEIERIDRTMSSQNTQGELSILDSKAGQDWVSISPDLYRVLERSQYYSRLSNGAFDVTIGPVERAWGFLSNSPHLPEPKKLKSELRLVDYRYIDLANGKIRLLKPGMEIDLGAIAKGYAVDRALEVIRKAGAFSGLIEAGGDLRFFGTKPGGKEWKIGIAHPRKNDQIITVKNIGLQAVATSGDYERFFFRDGKRYHHILDPRTGFPADKSVSVTIWTQTAMDADALSTTVFVLGPEKGLELIEKLPGTECLIFYEQNGQLRYKMSQGLNGKIENLAEFIGS